MSRASGPWFSITVTTHVHTNPHLQHLHNIIWISVSPSTYLRSYWLPPWRSSWSSVRRRSSPWAHRRRGWRERTRCSSAAPPHPDCRRCSASRPRRWWAGCRWAARWWCRQSLTWITNTGYRQPLIFQYIYHTKLAHFEALYRIQRSSTTTNNQLIGIVAIICH